MFPSFRKFCGNTAGIAAIDYALLVALIIVGLVISLKTLGLQLNTQFVNVTNGFH